MHAITSVTYLLESSGKVKVVDILYRSTRVPALTFTNKLLKKNTFSQWERCDLSRKPKHCVHWSKTDQKSDSAFSFSINSLFKPTELTTIHTRQTMHYTHMPVHTHTQSNTQDATQEPVPTTHTCVGGLPAHVRSGSLGRRGTKVWYYFHFWWDPLDQTVWLEKASGSRNTTPSRLPGQIISIKANDAGTNGPQRLLLAAAGLWQTTAMMWDLWSWCHQQLIRLDLPQSVQQRNTPTGSVFTQSAWEKNISCKHIWMFVGWMTKRF